MPFKPQTGDPNTSTNEGRAREGHAPGPPPNTINTTGTANPYSSPDPDNRIGEAQRNSMGLLSTKDILDLAGLDADKRSIAVVARKMARDWDLSPRVIFGETDPRQVISKMTGEPVSMREALRFTDRFTPVAIAAMLADALPEGTTELVRAKDAAKLGDLPVDLKGIGKFASVLARQGNFDLATGLGLAYTLSDKEKFSPRRFEQNYDMVRRWVTASKAYLSEQDLASIAIAISRKGVASNISDVATLLYGKDVVAKSQAVQDLTEGRGINLALQPGETELQAYQAGAIASGQAVPGDLRHGILGPDYWTDVQDAAKRVRLSQEAFDRSILGSVAGWTGDRFNDLWVATEKGLGILGLTLVTPVALGIAAVDPGSDIKGTWENIVEANGKLNDLIDSGKTVGWIVQEGYGNKFGVDIPDWVGTGIDFAIGSYVDPFALAGKGARWYREGHLLVENEATLGRTLVANVTSRVPVLGRVTSARAAEIGLRRNTRILRNLGKLGDSRLSTRLFGKLDDETGFLRELDLSGTGAITRHTLDYGYMKILREQLIERFGVAGLKSAEARKAWNEGLLAHFVGYGPEGSVAEQAVLRREALAPAALDEAQADIYARQMELPIYDTEPGLYLPSRGPDDLMHGWSLELPNASGLGIFGPRRLVRRAVTTQKFTETAAGRRVATLTNINPGRTMPLFGDGAREYTVQSARRWAVFNEAEVQDYARQVLAIQNAGVSVEKRLRGVMEKMQTEGLRRIVKPYNLSDEAFNALDEEVFGRIRKMNDRTSTFGVNAGKTGLDTPLMESQLENFFHVVDPIRVRAAVREYTGLGRRLTSHLRSALGRDLPEITRAVDTIPHNVATSLAGGVRYIHEGLIHTWKGLTVARPGYIPRVILGDENLRFLATTSSGFERIMAQQWWGLTGKLDETGLFTREFLGPNGEVIARVGLPGAYERNAAANSAIRSAENTATIVNRSKSFEQAYSSGLGWEVIHAKAGQLGHHLDAWTWDLTHQFSNSAPGRVALESVAAGDDIATTQARLMQWARDDKFITLKTRIGPASEQEALEWANDLSYLAHSYTLDRAPIAQAALTADARNVRKLLADVPPEVRPPVHGPTTEGLTRGVDEAVGNPILNQAYKRFVSNPENRMNRQPFFKVQKRRAEQGMYSLLEQAAKDNPALARKLAGEFKPRVLNPEEDLSSLVAAGDTTYYYHVTPEPNVESIIGTGIEPRQTFYGIKPESITPEMRGGRAFVAETPDIAMNATKSVVNKVLMRVPRTDVPHVFPDTAPVAGSFYSRSAIPTSNAEVLGEDGVWHAIGSTQRSVPGLSPDIVKRIDQASDAFAIEQVNKVMFDLTKQSRFTELLQFAFPFPQPFFEGFQAWGHIVRRNPEIVARAQALYRLGMATGMLREDKLTGETVMPLGPVAGLAKLFAGVGGLDPKRWDELGINFVAPLSSFNMLSSTTVRFGPDGAIGKLLGGVPIPVPGLRPDVQALAQWAFKNTTNEAAISYLFQYGPTTQFLPRSVQVALNGLGVTSDPLENSLRASLARAYQKAGIGFDEDGNMTMTEAEITAMVNRDAHTLAMARSLSALFSPASPRVKTASSPDEEAFQGYIEAHPGDFQAALDAWSKDHPDLWLVPVGKTYYDGAITDPRTGDKVTGPRLNASALVGRMLATPGVGDLMRRDKAWSGILLLGLDPAAVEQQDFPTYAKLVADGTFRYKSTSRFLSEGVDSKAWQAVGEFYTTFYNPALSALEANGVDDQDTAYTQLRLERQKFFAALYLRYPGWVSRNLKPYDSGGQEVDLGSGTITVKGFGGVEFDLKSPGKVTLGTDATTWDWAADDRYATAPLALDQARDIASAKGFEKFPGVQALNAYLDKRDEIRDTMRKKGYTSITQPNAENLASDLARTVESLDEETPGFGMYLSALLGIRTENGQLIASDDLQNVTSAKLSDYAALPPDIRDDAAAFDTRVEVLKDKAYRKYDTSDERSQRYLDLQRYVDSTYQSDPRIVRGWWKSLGPNGRQDWRETLVTKPPEFYTRWDWHVAGLNLDNNAALMWQRIAEARIGISQADTDAKARGVEFSTGNAYDGLNKAIADFAKTNKGFAKSLQAANDWAFPFKAARLDKLPGQVGEAWRNIVASTEAVQAEVNRQQLFGPSGFGNTDAQNAWYTNAQQQVLAYVKEWQDYSPAFKKSWYDFQEQLGDPIVETIMMPSEYYGPLGAVGYGD